MKKFLKDYLGLIAAIGLTGGSLFAFNISSSIDNALQVIKTIWVTSDGTTTNAPFVTMDGSGKYVSIGTTASGETLSVSGSLFAQDNETKIFAGNDGTAAFWFPIAGAYMGIDATASSGATAGIVAYDTRALDPNDGKLWVNIATNSNLGINGAESEASLNTSRGENMDLKVEVWFDFSNYDQQNHTWFVTSQNRAEISMDADHINIFTESWVVRTATGGGDDFDYSNSQSSRMQIDTNYVKIYGSWFAGMHFDSVLWLFGFGTNNPANTIDIGGWYVPGTLWLRFSGWAGNAWQVLGLNNAGDVVLLWTLGGGSSGPWEYGAGSPQSAQIRGAGNTSNGPRAVVGGLNNVWDGYAAFVWGGLYNEASSSGNVAVWGAYNRSHWSLLSTIVWGTYNTINSGGNVSFIGGWSDNTINDRNSAILVGNNNLIDGTSSTIWWGEYNTVHSSATQSFIGGGSGNATSWSLSFIGGGSDNILAWLYATLVGGATNILNGNYGFIGGWLSNVLSVWALYSFIGGGQNNSVTDRYSSIIWGLNNVVQSEKSFIGWGENNNIDLNSGLSAIVAGSGNTITPWSTHSFIGGGFNNIVDNAPASFIGWGSNNYITSWWPASIEYPNTIGWGNNNRALWILNTIAWWYNNTTNGTLFTIWWGNNNSIDADGDGSTIAWWSNNAMTWYGNKNIIGGGQFNMIADWSNSTIGGGWFNAITWTDSTIPWGRNNVVSGSSSFAAGQYAQALTDNTFVWNSSFSPFISTLPNTFLVNAQNGVGINTNDTNSKTLRVNWSVQANDYYSANNNQGMTTTLTNIGGGGCNMTFENGLLISTSGC
jgi:hypothetical protein